MSTSDITEWRLRGVRPDVFVKANRASDHDVGNEPQIRLFANYAKYRDDRSKLATVRPAHWKYDQTIESAGKVVLAGPFASDQGGLFVYNAVDRAEALSYISQDPFAVEGVLAAFELLEWVIEGVNPGLLTRDFAPSSEWSA